LQSLPHPAAGAATTGRPGRSSPTTKRRSPLAQRVARSDSDPQYDHLVQLARKRAEAEYSDLDVRELVHQTGGDKHPRSDDGVTADELDTEAVVVSAGHTAHAPGEDLTAVAADLLTTNGGQLGRRTPVVTEIAVHVRCRGVSRLSRVDDDDRSTLAAELEGRSQSGSRPPDNGDITMSLDSLDGMFTHAPDDTA